MTNKQPDRQHDDLFESGKAYRNSLFDSGGTYHPPSQGGFPGLPSSSQGFHQGQGGPPSLPGPWHGQYYSSPFPGSDPSSTTSPLGKLGQLPLKEIKGLVDRMGGIDGIINTITKMNAMMKNIQQMAPMVRLLMGSFFKSKSSEPTLAGRPYRRSRKRRRRTRPRSRTRTHTNRSYSYHRKSSSSRKKKTGRKAL